MKTYNMEDIKDNEIRIIGQNRTMSSETLIKDSDTKISKLPKRGNSWTKVIWFLVALCILCLLFYILTISSKSDVVDTQPDEIENFGEGIYDDPEPDIESMFEKNEATLSAVKTFEISNDVDTPHCTIFRDTINDIPLRILIPVGAKPEFHIGLVTEKTDKSIILALQAADIRRDNGEIVGASVYKGKVVGYGLAKRGFVYFEKGNLTIGVAERTPYFEEAVQKEGDFFRQYPLVDNGRLVENNPKNKSIRRALCERAGQIIFVESSTPESFHDFAQALVDLKVKNAVYIVGSQYACGFLRDSSTNTETWGEARFVKGKRAKNVSYIIWK